MLSHDCQIRVWYKHTDQMAICHHSNYICYYEAARSEFLRALGMSFAEVERRGCRSSKCSRNTASRPISTNC